MTLRRLLLMILFTLTPALQAQETKTQQRERVYQAEIQPLVIKYCFDCHGNGASEGDFNLDKYTGIQRILDGRSHWLKVLARLELEDMPPEDAEARPTKEEYKKLREFVDVVLYDIDCSGGPVAGHVTLRRLTRYEYRNTVRDLLGVDYAPAAGFPADEVGYGFDNIGDVLSLPPILLEKYLLAAEEITAKAIITAPPEPKSISDARGRRLRGDGSRNDAGRVLASQGEVYSEVEFPSDGEYLVRATASGDQAGDEPPRMELRIDGQQVHTFEVRNSDEAATFEFKLPAKRGKKRVALAFINDFYDPENADPQRRDRNLIVARLEVLGPISTKHENLPETHTRVITVTPNEQLSWSDAARQVLRPIITRAFRRPVTEDELNRLVQITDLAKQNGDNFETGIQLALQAVLVSPHFLFKVETPPGPDARPTDVRQLNEFELATRLSYFLWSSMPDEELMRLATEGKLREGDNLDKQVRRMLADERSLALVENFAGQWLTLRNLETVQPNRRFYREWSSEMRRDMRKETELFIAAVIREDMSLLRLLDADFTFVNERLAGLYDIPDVKGEEFRRVSLAGTPRAGLLTQASILTVTSNPTRTSPVKRGKWILENLLNEPPPPAPPGVPELESQKELTGTLREQMEQHRENPTCRSCHQVMDSLGFALENYDAIGNYREKDFGLPIDASGELPTGEKFTGAEELRALLLKSKREQYIACVTEKMLTYSLGRGIEYYDQCLIDDICQKLTQNDYRFSTLIVEIVKSHPFQHQGVKRSEEP